MESSEDDAGTATNASRRASAREKDVGLAEDVNATSSFQQKSSAAGSLCQIPAMSEDNFDGDSVPSPSSQDVNTSTEAILDMIDEIVDGPDAPKRLPLTSEFVDALNEEFAATSSNLNIIQESAKSQSDNKTQEAALPVNSAPADSETPLPAKIDAPAECSTPIDKPTDNVNTDSVDTLPASSSVPEGDETAVSVEQKPSVVSNVETETSTNCALPNIPSSSEKQTVQNVSDNSVCVPQDRTVKCVTSSDNRDNVTVESAESTSSDSSVSESKALNLEPQSRSPLRRRLVRPMPSDRRPDSTVSSTVDSQTVNIPATEQTSSENITKDVTSSSDAVPTIHGNVKPEEIRNLSEINFCQAETSESPKKIKLIRKNTTGTSNREPPLSLSSVSSEKEQCQSTSTDPVNVSNLNEPVNVSNLNEPVNVSNLNEPVNSVSLLSQSHNPETPILDSNCMSEIVSEPLADSAVKVCSDEHSQPSIESQHSPQKDDTQKDNGSNQDIIVEPSLCRPSSQELPLTGTCIIEKETGDSVSNSSEHTSYVNDLKQSSVFHTQDDNEDYIPLTLPSRSIGDQLKPISLKPNVEFGFKNAIPKSQNTELLKSTENLLKSKKIAPSLSELESKSNALHTTSSVFKEIGDKISDSDSNSSESESKVPKLESTSSDIMSKNEPPSKAEPNSSVVESETSALESRSSVVESKSSELISDDSESKSVSNVLESTSSGLESKCNEPELKSSEEELENSELKSKISEPESKSTEIASESCVNEPIRSETLKSKSKDVIPEPKSCVIESEIVEQESKDIVHESSSIMPDSNSTELQSKISTIVSTGSNISTIESTDSVFESKSKELKNSEIQTSITVVESDTRDIQPKRSISDSKSIQIDSKNSEVALSNDLQPKDCDVKLESNVLDSTSSESLSNTSDPQPRSSDLAPQSSDLQPLSCDLQPLSSDLQPLSSEVESNKVEPESKVNELKSSISVAVNCQPDSSNELHEDQKKVPPIKLNLSRSSLSESKLEIQHTSINKNNLPHEESDSTKQVPKLTIKLKQPESPVPKVTIKPIRPPVEDAEDIPCVTKINIKPIVKPIDNFNDKPIKSQSEVDNKDVKVSVSEPIPSITKLNIKPVLKPPEKINDVHRKSSSSEISESEYSENDETTSTSDQASASDHGSSEVVPKVTIKLGKPGTESEGKFYTEKNVPKLTIKGIQQDEKLIISQSECLQPEKVPKLTIKTVTKSEGQPLSPKLTIKPLKSPDTPNKEGEFSKLKISTESFSSTTEGKESPHVPKITIKPVTRIDGETRTPKKSTSMCDSPEHIPVVTKLNIKPILKPADSGESSESFDDKVPVVSKLNIKPVIKPKDNDLDSSVDDVPKITKLNIKPIKNPEEKSSEEKDCDEMNTDIDENSIPVVTKINIKPIIKPQEEEKEKDTENLSSETGNSSDDNGDHIPVVTKLNIKPIVKPDELQESSKSVSSTEQSIPVVTKLNIKPLVKPGESSPASPKKEHKMDIPIVTKLNIKPVLRPDDAEISKSKDDSEDKSTKNPPLVMKINMKTVTENLNHEGSYNENYISDCLLTIASKVTKASEIGKTSERKEKGHDLESVNDCSETRLMAHSPKEKSIKQNCVPEFIQKHEESDERTTVIKKPSLNTPTVKPKLNDTVTEKQHSPKIATVTKCDSIQSAPTLQDSNISKEGKISIPNETHTSQENKNINYKCVETDTSVKQSFGRQKVSAVQNCTLLKKLLENTRDSLDKEKERTQLVNCGLSADKSQSTFSACKNINSEQPVDLVKYTSEKTTIRNIEEIVQRRSATPEKVNDLNKLDSGKSHTMEKLSEEVKDSVTKPLEITISDKVTNPSSGQDSPRIILKINKTDHGSSAKIITEDLKRPDTLQDYAENTQEIVNDKQSPKKHVANSRRKQTTDMSLNLSTGKRLRSSRIVENTEKSQVKKNVGKRPSATETPSPPQNKESELSILQAKRLKLGQLLSANKPLNMSPVLPSQTSPTKTNLEAKSPTKTNLEAKVVVKSVNHSILNNENCSKNGNSKLHNILSTLQAKQMQTLANNNTNCSEKAHTVPSDIDCNASMSSSDTAEVAPAENSHPELQEMIINENSDFRDFTGPEDTSQDPLEVDVKPREVPAEVVEIPKPVELTPQPKKRGRPRKLPVSEGAKPVVTLPVPALEERPQRSLRLMRDRPAILLKPRGGRGRGRGRRPATSSPIAEPEPITIIETAPEEPIEERQDVDIDPTSSRIKLPRMTEALDKMPSVCTTPLSSRRRNSSGTFSTGDTNDTKVTFDSPPLKDEFPNTPEPSGSGRGRGGRGSRGGRGRTPRGRGRGRGGGRGAMYMKETLGIYGRVCGPATTTVQLFEEETCMMDDNATPAKPSHLLDEDSQSSVKSSTNESNKMKKSKFADLFDSNKVWTAADVKEYTWPSPDKADGEPKVMMIQEQVAMFLGVKSFKRRYQELKRRTISGEERDYVLSKGLVTEALCDLGITAVDASEVLDIMLSDYPHKYEEFRSYQRQRQLTGTPEESMEETKPEEKVVKVEMKPEKPAEHKPELPKVDPEKARLDMAAAAIASASEWNARANASRRMACADLQSLVVLRPRAAPTAPARPHLRPPAGFYPHALLPGQYQHSYRVYTPEQLRYFPLNTVLAAPPAPVSATDYNSESEPDWGSRCSSSDDSDVPTHQSAKRKKLSKVKRASHVEASTSSVKEESRDEVVDTCRVCKLRLEANRKYTHERFLACANCNNKLHPSCVELSADTIRKCREYPWQCAECKTCCSCQQPADDDKMLFCDLCDRGFHIYCVGLDNVPSGRWHCVECAVCKSCGARSPDGGGGGGALAAGAGAAPPADWHHQTRRGPGGHKVYSHSLCTPCARAYRIGRYCPLCERSFIGPKGTMQLVICKLCDRQLHQECVRQTVSVLNVLDYTCAECRRGGITSRAAAVRLAPRTIATLFMAKRRFNKYAHRQYMQSRLRELAAPDDNSADPDADPLDAPDCPDLPDLPDHSDHPDAPE